MLSDIVNQGKKNQGSLKKQKYINIMVMFGFAMMLTWIGWLQPMTFIKITYMLALLFLPALVLTFFFSNRIIKICGYEMFLSDNFKYNVLIRLASYLVVMVPVGNFLVFMFLIINYALASPKIETAYVTPMNIGESTSRKTGSTYSNFDIVYDGARKQINTGDTPIDSISGKKMRLKLAKGYFGYYVIKGKRLQ